MAQPDPIEVFLEIGKKRTFAGAIQWPGWCRGGRDEQSALLALLEYAPRYAGVLRTARIEFQSPADTSDFVVQECLEGDATTDFGAPSKTLSSDAEPVGEGELLHLQNLLKASWQAFDAAARSAEGRELRKGPRGGGRDLDRIIRHVLESEQGYLTRIGYRPPKFPGGDTAQELAHLRGAILDALATVSRDGVPAQGPRGGVRWTMRQFVRRVVWHALDHAWELEDRVTSS